MTLNKLADVLVAQVLRFAVTAGLLSSGLFAGLADPQLRRATLELIRTPEHPWSVASLAQKALMSRSAFAARFQAVVGRTPLDLLREWRMQVAVGLLRSGRTVADVAITTGYDTEASFAKAFKRVTGMGPGALRRGRDRPANHAGARRRDSFRGAEHIVGSTSFSGDRRSLTRSS